MNTMKETIKKSVEMKRIRFIVNSNKILPDFIGSREDAIDYAKRQSSRGERISLSEQHLASDGRVSVAIFHGTFQFGELRT